MASIKACVQVQTHINVYAQIAFEYITCVSVSIRKHINMYASRVDLYMSEICEILQANIYAYKSSARICMYMYV